MGRQVTITCDSCGKEIKQVAAKLYLAPVLPGKAQTSFMSGYSHYSDLCIDCKKEIEPKMKRRQARNGKNNGRATTKKTRTKGKTRA